MGVDDTFIDLGSGRGRVVLHAALKTDVGMALGVELSSLRHAIAEAALDALQQRGTSSVAAVASFRFMYGAGAFSSPRLGACATQGYTRVMAWSCTAMTS